METSITIIEHKEIKSDTTTGLSIIGTHTGVTGFKHNLGLRQFGDLTIAESIAQGVGVTYLSGVQVYDKNSQLIIDVPVANGVKYSREVVRKLVLKALFRMLKDAAADGGKSFDERATRELIDTKLRHAYYEQSYSAVMEWAKEIGVEFN